MQLPEFDINSPDSCRSAIQELQQNILNALAASTDETPVLNCHLDPTVLEALFRSCMAHREYEVMGEFLSSITEACVQQHAQVWYDNDHPVGTVCGEFLIQADVRYVPIYADYLHLYELSDDQWFYGTVRDVLGRYGLTDETVMLLLHCCCGLATESAPEELADICQTYDLADWLEQSDNLDDFLATVSDHWFLSADVDGLEGYLVETIDDAIEDGEVELNGLRVCKALIAAIYTPHPERLEDVLVTFTATYLARVRDALYSAHEQESVVLLDIDPRPETSEWKPLDTSRLPARDDVVLLCEVASQGMMDGRSTAINLMFRQGADTEALETVAYAEDDERLQKVENTFAVTAPFHTVEYRYAIDYSGSPNDKVYFLIQTVDEA